MAHFGSERVARFTLERWPASDRYARPASSEYADWAALGMEEAARLPAVQWKIRNLEQLPEDRRLGLASRLEKVLYPD